MRYERGRTLHEHIQEPPRHARRALGPQHLRAAARRPARGAHAQAAAPRHQAGERLRAQRRHAAAHRFRRRAPGAVGRGHEAAADLHAGLRRARDAPRARAARPMERHLLGGRDDVRLPRRRARRSRRTRGWRRTCWCRRAAPCAGKYSAELLEIVDWCLHLDPPAATAERARAAEGPAWEKSSDASSEADEVQRRPDAHRRTHRTRTASALERARRAADGGGRRPGRPPARRGGGADLRSTSSAPRSRREAQPRLDDPAEFLAARARGGARGDPARGATSAGCRTRRAP